MCHLQHAIIRNLGDLLIKVITSWVIHSEFSEFNVIFRAFVAVFFFENELGRACRQGLLMTWMIKTT